MHRRKRMTKRERKMGGNNNIRELNMGNIQFEKVNAPYTVNVSNRKANTIRKVNTIRHSTNKNVITSINTPSSQVIQVARSPISSLASTASSFSIPSQRSSLTLSSRRSSINLPSREEIIRRIQTMNDSEFLKLQTCLI